MKDRTSFFKTTIIWMVTILVIVILGEVSQNQEKRTLQEVSNVFIINTVMNKSPDNPYYYSVRVNDQDNSVKAVFIIGYQLDQDWSKGDTLILTKEIK